MPDDKDNGPKTEQRPPWGGSGRGMMDERPPQQQQRPPPPQNERALAAQAEVAAPTRSAEEVAKQYQDRRNRSALGKILAQEQRRARARASAK